MKHRLQTAGVTKPGTKRRRHQRDNDGRLIVSPEMSPSDSSKSPTEVTDGRSDLYGEIQEFVDDLEDINIDDLVRHDIPDLIIPSLMGVMDTATGDSPSPDHQTFERCLSPSPTSAAPRVRLSADGRYREECEPECGAASPQIQLDYDDIPAELLHSNSSPPGGARGGSQVQSLTSRLRRRGGSQVSDSSLESETKVVSSKSLISRLNMINKSSSREGSSSTDSAYKSEQSLQSVTDDEENDAKVSELTKRFGGARKACLNKIKTKISKTDSDRPMVEAKGTRGDCFPAVVFMLTPFAVVILAGGKNETKLFILFNGVIISVVLNFLWGLYSGVSEIINH